MKKSILLLFLASTINLFAQEEVTTSNIQPFQKPKEGKSLVYIIKSGPGAFVNFRTFLNNKFLGVVTIDSYLIVECDSGKQLFWATSENRDYIEADLLPNKVYVLNAEGQMGAFVAGVNFKQLNPNEKSSKNLFARKLKNSNAVIYDPNNTEIEDKTENITKGLSKYKELKKDNSEKIIQLDNSLFFEDGEKFIKSEE